MKKQNKAIVGRHCSFITFNIVDWVDVFIRPACKEVISEALNRFIESGKAVVYAWCLMSNHLHLLVATKDNAALAAFEKEFKKFTSSRILDLLAYEPDLRRNWMLQRFEHCSQSLKCIDRFQLWQNCINPSYIEFRQLFKLQERVLYIHENPVRDSIVSKPEEYLYSSARDYAGRKGLVNIQIIDFAELRKAVLKNDQ